MSKCKGKLKKNSDQATTSSSSSSYTVKNKKRTEAASTARTLKQRSVSAQTVRDGQMTLSHAYCRSILTVGKWKPKIRVKRIYDLEDNAKGHKIYQTNETMQTPPATKSAGSGR